MLSECNHDKAREHGKGAEFQGGEGEGRSGEVAGMLKGEEGRALYHCLQVISLLLSSCVMLVYDLSYWTVRLPDP